MIWLAAVAVGVSVFLVTKPTPRKTIELPKITGGWLSWLWWAGLGLALGFLVGGGAGWVAVMTVVSLSVKYLLVEREAANRRRKRAAVRSQFPDTASLLAATLGAGLPIRNAIAQVAKVSESPTSQLLDQVVSQLDIGRDATKAWEVLADEPCWSDAGADMAVASWAGAKVADLLATQADDVRAQLAARKETKAKTVAVRSVLPLMCCFLPSFMLVGVIPIIAGVILKGIF